MREQKKPELQRKIEHIIFKDETNYAKLFDGGAAESN